MNVTVSQKSNLLVPRLWKRDRWVRFYIRLKLNAEITISMENLIMDGLPEVTYRDPYTFKKTFLTPERRGAYAIGDKEVIVAFRGLRGWWHSAEFVRRFNEKLNNELIDCPTCGALISKYEEPYGMFGDESHEDEAPHGPCCEPTGSGRRRRQPVLAA